ncbi:thiamine diphosphokinase [Anaerobacillus alkalilacustris]|uniref:Thiamine diphosphokinase n=1 Tax=Anaerobacillus alkalilacustris TaxID=393763 RepID=A0A1S2LL74_9BACI|nr:thiamine diphosphokinase [Anaerobacillus alkalilacustris]OIJ13211.1 thiamine diphosphokinase [Anaerobacillus alkalilacustris]
MKRIHIVAGGPSMSLPSLYKKSKDEIWIGVDGGVEHLVEFEIEPDYAIGDFDSISVRTKRNVRVSSYKQFPSEKDETDLELALTFAIEKSPEEIIIYGATGGRLDHEMINLQLLKKGIKNSVNIYIVDNKNRITVKKPGSYDIFRSNYKYISFLSMFEYVEDLTLQGFKYPLTKTKLKYGSSLCISNELIVNRGTYSFSFGILIVVESID